MTDDRSPADTASMGDAIRETILKSSPDIIMVVGDAGDITYVNPAVVELLGYEIGELAGQKQDRIIHSGDQARLAQFRDLVLASSAPVEARYRVKHADGRWVWLDTRMRRIETTHARLPDAVVITAREATTQVELETAFHKAKDEAEEANRAKSEFLSRMSHELRTPLNAILGFAQLLGMEEDISPENKESLKEIQRGGAHLLELINEVLDISRIEAGKLKLSIEPVELGSVVQESLSMIGPLADQRRVEIDHEFPDSSRHVMADRHRLKQVLLNLLSNAVKYNREGGRITLRCEEAGEGRLRVGISDTGTGIPSDKMDLLFSPFERLGAELYEPEGSGLGLALTKRLVEAMHGDMSVESEVGAGSTFWVDLPASETQAESEPRGGSDGEAPATGERILYIEDNPANLRLVESLIAKHRPGIKLMSAMQGRAGLELARLHRPLLLLLDVNLPDLGGEQILERLKQDDGTSSIRVVVLSADANDEQMRRLLGAGASDYITKPLNVERLLQTIDDSLGKAEGADPP